ncbi:MAG: hypothetical protein R3C01_17285 [Planctomycetaceae bacterium]
MSLETVIASDNPSAEISVDGGGSPAGTSLWGDIIGSLLSIAFWGTLVVASGLFAIVVLAPRVVAHASLEREFYTAHRELVTIQQEVRHLERVERALKEDPRFLAEVARQELDAGRSHDLLLSVGSELQFDARLPQLDDDLPEYVEPWYVHPLTALNADAALRQQLCLIAAGLLIFGFVLLHDGPGPRRVVELLAEPIRQLLVRYHSPCNHVVGNNAAESAIATIDTD